jgi:hypothetical protein
MSIRERLRKRSNQLSEALLGHADPDPQSRVYSGDYAHYHVSKEQHRVKPDQGDLERYWELYKKTPLVRVSINTFADDVTAPGVRVLADDDELQSELARWKRNAAIIGGESHRELDELLYLKVIQEQVRGTALAEAVPTKENLDDLYGFRLVNPSTVVTYTYESQPVLIRPDEKDIEDVFETKRGEASAYGQWDDGALAGPFNRETVHLSQNDIIKLVQDPDTHDIFGNSTIAPVSEEIEELHRMLEDIGEAVHNKAWPHWLFQLGEPSGDPQNPRKGVWPSEKIKDFRDEHKNGNWSAGQKDFVPGDADVEVIDSDVPEIEDLLGEYIELILSAMPVPKAKLGFAGDINRDIVKEQIPQYERRVRSKRRDLESAFEPYFRRKARELGYDDEAVESIELRIEEERETNPLKREDFDTEDFAQFCQGLEAAGGGDATEIVDPDEMRDLLGLPDRDDNEDVSELAEDIDGDFEDTFGEPVVPDELEDGELGVDVSDTGEEPASAD